MQTAIAKWGNSLALRLPRNLAENARLVEGTPVDLQVEGDKLVVTPARPKYKLADLLMGINEKAKHQETEWGAARGKEVW